MFFSISPLKNVYKQKECEKLESSPKWPTSAPLLQMRSNWGHIAAWRPCPRPPLPGPWLFPLQPGNPRQRSLVTPSQHSSRFPTNHQVLWCFPSQSHLSSCPLSAVEYSPFLGCSEAGLLSLAQSCFPWQSSLLIPESQLSLVEHFLLQESCPMIAMYLISS